MKQEGFVCRTRKLLATRSRRVSVSRLTGTQRPRTATDHSEPRKHRTDKNGEAVRRAISHRPRARALPQKTAPAFRKNRCPEFPPPVAFFCTHNCFIARGVGGSSQHVPRRRHGRVVFSLPRRPTGERRRPVRDPGLVRDPRWRYRTPRTAADKQVTCPSRTKDGRRAAADTTSWFTSVRPSEEPSERKPLDAAQFRSAKERKGGQRSLPLDARAAASRVAAAKHGGAPR